MVAEEPEGNNRDIMLRKTIEWALAVDPGSVRRYVEAKKRAHPKESPRQLAQRVVSSYASQAGFEGFVTGLAGNPFVAVGAGVADAGVILRFYAWLTAVIGFLFNDKYFEDPDWENDAYLFLIGSKGVSRALREAGVQVGRQSAKHLIRRYIRGPVLRWVKKTILKWFGKKVTQRAIIAKAVPLIGGLIGGGWNYIEIHQVGRRIIRYHFEGELPDETLEDSLNQNNPSWRERAGSWIRSLPFRKG